jgi:hypothetical protein
MAALFSFILQARGGGHSLNPDVQSYAPFISVADDATFSIPTGCEDSARKTGNGSALNLNQCSIEN